VGDEYAEDVAQAVDVHGVTDLGEVAVAGEKVVAISGLAAQGIATDQDGYDPEDDEVSHAGVEDGSQDAEAPGSHRELSEDSGIVVS